MSSEEDKIFDAEFQEEAEKDDSKAIVLQDIEFSAEKAIALAQKQIDFLNKVKKATLRLTRSADWVRHRQSGKESFYLQATGAEKVKTVWGIYTKGRPTITNLGTVEKPIYEVQGIIGSKVLNTEQFILGGRSSCDDFYEKQGETLDILDVRKAALSNWFTRGVQMITGMRNTSAEDLEAGGIDLKKVSGFEFKQGEKGAYDSSQRAESTPEIEELRKKIGAMIMEMAGGDKETAQSLLGDFTEFTNKEGEKVGRKTSITKLTVRQIKPTYGKVKKAYDTEFAGPKDE